MTTGGVEVDLDRLADFVGGALDGTPDAADVRHLVSTDARWGDAYAALVAADGTLRDQLGAWGDEALAMPAEVLDRLDAALAAAAAARAEGTGIPRAPATRRDDLAARRRRRQRWTAGLATAAAVLVCGALGVTALQTTQNRDNTTTSAGSGKGKADAPLTAPSPFGAEGAPGPAVVVATGNDYSPETLGQVAANAAPLAPAQGDRNSAGDSAKGSRPNMLDVPNTLERLRDPGAQSACLNAIVVEYGGRVALVDFARFQGAPALVVLVDGARAAAGKRWVVVVGPACGQGNMIADERYHGTI